MGPVSIGVEVQRNTDGDTPSRVGGQSGCERRIEVFVKIQKKDFFLGGGGGGVRGGGGSVGRGSGSGWGVRVVVNEELKFL